MNERAAQFAPFAALKEYSSVTEEMRRITEPKRELSEDKAAELSDKLNKLRRKMSVTVTYYKDNQYVTISGIVTEWEPVFRRLRIDNEIIPTEDIAEIQ